MKIVFDTSVLYDHWFLEGPHFDLLARLLSSTAGVQVVVPEVVVLEVVKKYGDVVDQLHGEHTGHLEKARRVEARLRALRVPSPITTAEPTVPDDGKDSGQVLADYEVALRKRLADFRAVSPSYDKVSQEVVLKRCLETRRPFREDKGYRDTLIWETILSEVADESDETVFVTKNHKDFADVNDEAVLHPHLKEDLKARGLPEDCVKLCGSLEALSSQYVSPQMKRLEDIMGLLQQDNYPGFSLVSWFKDNREELAKLLTDKVGGLTEASFQLRKLEDVTVEYLEDPNLWVIQDVVELEAGHFFISALIHSEAVLEGFLFKSDSYALSGDMDLCVLVEDWNEHYMWVSANVMAPINVSLVVDEKAIEAVGFDADFAEFYGWCRHCGAPFLSDAAETCFRCGKS